MVFCKRFSVNFQTLLKLITKLLELFKELLHFTKCYLETLAVGPFNLFIISKNLIIVGRIELVGIAMKIHLSNWVVRIYTCRCSITQGHSQSTLNFWISLQSRNIFHSTIPWKKYSTANWKNLSIAPNFLSPDSCQQTC